MTCLCGCGRETGNEFAPGHDARYKSQLLRRYIVDGDQDALAILQTRKWTKFIEPARRQHKIREARKVRMARIERKKEVQDDPSLYTDRLLLMKCAGDVLKHSDQYYRSRPNYVAIANWVDAMVIIAGEHPKVLIDPAEIYDLLPAHFPRVAARFIDAPEVRTLGLDFEPLRLFLTAPAQQVA